MKKLLWAVLLVGFNCHAGTYYSFQNDSIEELRTGEKKSEFKPRVKAVNFSIASHHTDEPGCKPEDYAGKERSMCRRALAEGYNEVNPGGNIEFALNSYVHLVAGFAKASYDEVSLFGGIGFEGKPSANTAIGFEVGGITNHLASVFAGPYFKYKYLKLHYFPETDEGSDTYSLQLSIPIEWGAQ